VVSDGYSGAIVVAAVHLPTRSSDVLALRVRGGGKMADLLGTPPCFMRWRLSRETSWRASALGAVNSGDARRRGMRKASEEASRQQGWRGMHIFSKTCSAHSSLCNTALACHLLLAASLYYAQHPPHPPISRPRAYILHARRAYVVARALWSWRPVVLWRGTLCLQSAHRAAPADAHLSMPSLAPPVLCCRRISALPNGDLLWRTCMLSQTWAWK